MSLKLMLDEAASRYGKKTAIVSDDRRLSYADLDEASNRVANALIKMGVNKGDRVAMLLSNSPEFVIIYFGIVKIGAVAVPLDIKYKVAELTSLFADCQPKVLLTESPALEPLIPVLSQFKSIRHVIDLNPGANGAFPGYREIIAAGSARQIETALEPEDVAYIAYTSGPSFDPRGVMLSHQSLLREATISGDGFQQTDKDVVMLFALPMHHVVGLVMVMLTAISNGSTVVMLPGVSIPTLTETIEREKVTIFMGVPFVFALMVRSAEDDGIRHNLSSLRLCASGGAALPVALAKRFKQLYGLDIAQFWGLTEAACHVTCQSVDGSGEPGSVGKALPGWQLKIVDDSGNELSPGQAGEVIIRGPIMKGYYNNPQATAEVIKNGWFYTGDIGRVDGEGNLFITGRKKDMIIVKGQNIYPGDIESVLSTHPKVAEAAVMAFPDAMRGEVVGVVVSLKEGAVATEPEIRRFCLERIANYKVPKQVISLKSLPRTTTGQIDKESIRVQLSIPSLFQEIAVS
ncbi:class I adenylate-forming enzyme family protein [Chloroflexota bacterium]